MKKFALAAILTVTASTAFAGSLSDPVVTPDVVVADATGSSGGLVMTLLIVSLVAAAVSD